MSHPAPHESGQLITVDGRTLPLRGAALWARAQGGLCRSTLTQHFVNPYPEALSVTYRMPLPADGAVSGYAFTLDGRRIVGEVDRKQRARERFEQAMVEGRAAGIVEEERTSLFTQELGNLPPGATVVAELIVDQKLAFLPEGLWEWRFPTAAAPRYLGTEVTDPSRLQVEVADAPMAPRLNLRLEIGDALAEGRAVESPSHSLQSMRLPGRTEVGFSGEGGVSLDRDVVVRWPARGQQVGLAIDVARPAAVERGAEYAHALLTLTPPERHSAPVSRDLILLIDTSGSMSGAPLDQARRVLLALIDSLTDQDSLEMVEFSNAPRRWNAGPVPASEAQRRKAAAWLGKLKASGGTEMGSGVLAALQPLRVESQRQVVLVTDGLIGSEQEIIRTLVEKLPRGCRFHAVAVGSAANRSLTSAAARAGRGTELVLGIDEDAERVARRLVARTAAPLVTDVTVEGPALVGLAPERPADLYAGAPVMLSAAVRPQGGTLRVHGRMVTGPFMAEVQVPARAPGEGDAALSALYAREAVEDWSLRLAAGHPQSEVDAAVEKLGLTFQISTRLTTWIAVSDTVDVDPSRPGRRASVPQALPYGMSVEGLGLRAASASPMPESAAAAAPPTWFGMAEGRSVLRQVKRERAPAAMSQSDLQDEAQEELATPRSASKSAPKGTDPSARSRRLQGKLRLSKDGRVTLEITVEGEPLLWSLPQEAVLVLEDGSLQPASIDLALSTALVQAAVGHVLRLTLELPEALALRVKAIRIGLPMAEVEVTLSGG